MKDKEKRLQLVQILSIEKGTLWQYNLSPVSQQNH